MPMKCIGREVAIEIAEERQTIDGQKRDRLPMGKGCRCAEAPACKGHRRDRTTAGIGRHRAKDADMQRHRLQTNVANE